MCIRDRAERNAELQLIRERAVLEEQERYVAKELSDGFADLDRAFKLAQINFNRAISSRQRLEGEKLKYDIGTNLLQFVLDAESQLADAESQFFRSLVDYNLAAAKIHFAKGTYLDYLGISLSEGPWVANAYRSAAKEADRYGPRVFNYCISKPGRLSQGPYPQLILPREEGEPEEVPLPSEPLPAP